MGPTGGCGRRQFPEQRRRERGSRPQALHAPAPRWQRLAAPGGHDRIPGREWDDWLSADANELLVDELVSPVAAQLAAESGALDAAERKLWSIGADDVHVDHPGIDLVRDALCLLLVVRHQIGAEAVRGVVRELYGFLFVRDAVDLRDRAEELLAAGLVVRADVSQDGRLEEVAVAVAAELQLRALIDRALDLLLEPIRGELGRQRPHTGVGRMWIP